MKNVISIVLIIGFLFVDFLFFHDILKAGEATTLAQYLTGVLSILVIILSVQNIQNTKRHSKS